MAGSSASAKLPAGFETERHRETRRLAFLFAALYFVQGVGEPSTGLVAQPVRSLLTKTWGLSPQELSTFMFVLGLPWSIKPLFGLLTDFVPILGTRRKSYLILTSSIMAIGLLFASVAPLADKATSTLMLLLLLPTTGIAFGDVVTDGLMVEKGQPLGITGRLQSAQWTAVYTAGIMTGVVGGYLSQHGMQRVGFAICGSLALVTLVLAIFMVDEPRTSTLDRGSFKRALQALWQTARSKVVVAVGVFLFLLNFNPFSSDVLYVYMTQVLKLSDQFVGTLDSVQSVGSIVGCVVYGIYSTRVPFRWLIHGSIVLAIVATLAYLGLQGQVTAVVIAATVGFVLMLTTLIQLDLAARFVPVATAGTAFALLMSLSNFSVSLSSIVGGSFYERLAKSYGEHAAFHWLVVIGALFTAACWFLTVLLPDHDENAEKAAAEEDAEIARASGSGEVEGLA